MTPDYLRQISEAIYGPEWQRALARGLGPLHPDGARSAIDDSLVRKWARGARPIPAWVGVALLTLVDQAVEHYADRADRLRRIADDLRAKRPLPRVSERGASLSTSAPGGTGVPGLPPR